MKTVSSSFEPVITNPPWSRPRKPLPPFVDPPLRFYDPNLFAAVTRSGQEFLRSSMSRQLQLLILMELDMDDTRPMEERVLDLYARTL